MFNSRIPTLICLILTFFSCRNEQKNPGDEISFEEKSIGELAETSAIAGFFSDSTETKKLNLRSTEAVADFYKTGGYEPVWKTHQLREDLYSGIRAISEEGLEPEDYNEEYLRNSLTNLSSLYGQERVRLEILLTDSFYQLLHDLYYGKLNPEALYEIWDIKKEDIEISMLMKKAFDNEGITEVLNSVKPHHPVYNGLKKSLAEFNSALASEESGEKITHIEEGQIIKPGEEDTRIPSVVKRLKELNISVDTDSVTSAYTPAIEQAVKNFQEKYGLEIDGIVGSGTIRNLNKTREDRREQILANLERWRWFPRDFGNHYIIVNIPNYQLTVVREGNTISKHKVMVGVQARKTPVFSDEIEYVVYNPTWTIPPTIKKNDVIPGAAKDISYLRNRNLKVYSSSGETIDPSSIDWNSGEALKYTYRQEAGSTNPLGRVKIIYPNQYLIYLHDTPSKALFERNSRAQSSGCVRVQDAIGLSKYLLSNREQYSSEKIDSIIASGKTTKVEVTQPVNVYHLYWTAWRENNKTKFTEDIYNTDEEILNLLQKNQ
ncbi:L,D-transpeptidase family protein [Autumnicola musiva]|uniref:L,D-transpeptidase family protein n=1 Tax=Autumnicola musiva TaxID=3075589 RepID=A0ABU3D8P1_9FLAO|nr:L,D-transpeptidase family protein [Zunongwangia sp. F117]MDT0677811.1 L,D-transpeptidase family protein [Zunongwangia sp. F117]